MGINQVLKMVEKWIIFRKTGLVPQKSTGRKSRCRVDIKQKSRIPGCYQVD